MIKMNLKEILKNKDMTQKELSLKTKIRPATISSYYNNTFSTISKDNLDKLCEVLNCDVSNLIEYTSNNVENDSINMSDKSSLEKHQNNSLYEAMMSTDSYANKSCKLDFIGTSGAGKTTFITEYINSQSQEILNQILNSEEFQQNLSKHIIKTVENMSKEPINIPNNNTNKKD